MWSQLINVSKLSFCISDSQPIVPQHIPFDIFDIANLTVLKLRNNPIHEITSDIAMLRNLRVLVVSFCMISTLPLGYVLPIVYQWSFSTLSPPCRQGMSYPQFTSGHFPHYLHPAATKYLKCPYVCPSNWRQSMP